MSLSLVIFYATLYPLLEFRVATQMPHSHYFPTQLSRFLASTRSFRFLAPIVWLFGFPTPTQLFGFLAPTHRPDVISLPSGFQDTAKSCESVSFPSNHTRTLCNSNRTTDLWTAIRRSRPRSTQSISPATSAKPQGVYRVPLRTSVYH